MGRCFGVEPQQVFYKGKIFKTYFDPRLREQDWGNFRTDEATKAIEEERDKYGAFHYRFLNGESCADVYDRMSLHFDTLFRDWTIAWWEWLFWRWLRPRERRYRRARSFAPRLADEDVQVDARGVRAV
jgi:hypothetical protein